MALTIGQKLWFVPSDERRLNHSHEVTILKVGLKWAAIGDNMRIDISTMWADGRGYMSPGRCWLTRSDWEAERERCTRWKELRWTIDRAYGPPAHITTDEILAALAMVKGPPT